MLSTCIERTGIHHFNIRHLGSFINCHIGRVIIVHSQQADRALAIAQFEVFRESTIHLWNELYREWRAVDLVEDCHFYSFFSVVERSEEHTSELQSLAYL